MKGAQEGIVVAGGNGYGSSLKQLSYPEGVIVDLWGRIYVADYNNHRVMRWKEGNTEGEIIVGGNGKGQNSDQLSHPTGLSFDIEQNLYAVDKENNRVQKFEKDVD
jgi:sugar lactone lactonase YvrE